VKNAYIHDGSGWQSLKGPPGPSEPSKDAGNALTVGSDGLLMLKGDTQFSGEWTPITFVGGPGFAEGYWTRTGKAVTVTLLFELSEEPDGETYAGTIEGLPFSAAEFFSPNSSSSGLFFAPVIAEGEGVIGHCIISGLVPNAIALSTKGPYSTQPVTVTLTYLTDDPPLR
jgi:hypothetical protein